MNEVVYVKQIGPPSISALVDLKAILGIERTRSQVLGQRGVEQEHQHVGWRQPPEPVKVVLEYGAAGYLRVRFVQLLHEREARERSAESKRQRVNTPVQQHQLQFQHPKTYLSTKKESTLKKPLMMMEKENHLAHSKSMRRLSIDFAGLVELEVTV